MNNEEVRKARRWSVPVVGLASASIIGLNYVWGHYREAMSVGAEFSESDVLRHIAEAPFSLSLTSSVLMLSGVLCAVLAARKAYTSTDKFPGYEAVDRRFRDAEDAKDDLKNAIEGQLDAIRAVDVDGVAERLGAERGMLEDVRRRYSAHQVASAKARELDRADVEAAEAVVERYWSVRAQVGRGVEHAGHEATRFAHLISTTAHADLASVIAEVADLQAAAAEGLSAGVAQERQRIAVAKENTEAIMLSVEQAGQRESDVLNLSEVKALLDIEMMSVKGKEKSS